jgi:hypothetical protein
MALPTSRNTTYVAGVSEVKAADLNDLQDKIIDLYSGKHGDRTLVLPGALAQGTLFQATGAQWDFSSILSGGTGTDAKWFNPSSTSAGLVFGIPLRLGDRIKSVTVYCQDTNTNNLIVNLRKYVPSTGTLITSASSDGTGAKQTVVMASLTETLTASSFYTVGIYPSTGSIVDDEVYGVVVVYDHP